MAKPPFHYEVDDVVSKCVRSVGAVQMPRRPAECKKHTRPRRPVEQLRKLRLYRWCKGNGTYRLNSVVLQGGMETSILVACLVKAVLRSMADVVRAC